MWKLRSSAQFPLNKTLVLLRKAIQQDFCEVMLRKTQWVRVFVEECSATIKQNMLESTFETIGLSAPHLIRNTSSEVNGVGSVVFWSRIIRKHKENVGKRTVRLFFLPQAAEGVDPSHYLQQTCMNTVEGTSSLLKAQLLRYYRGKL